MYTCYIQSFKILDRFCNWAGRFESDLVENPRRHIFAWCGSYGNLNEIYYSKFTKDHSSKIGLIIARTNEPSHEIIVLFVLCKLVLQMCMHSHPVGLDMWFLVGSFIYFHTSCGETVRMCRLTWAFAGRLRDKYHNLMSWLKCLTKARVMNSKKEICNRNRKKPYGPYK